MQIYLVHGTTYEEHDSNKAFKNKKAAELYADALNNNKNEYYWYNVEEVELIE